MPTNSRAATLELRPDAGADLALPGGQFGFPGRPAAHHIGADIVADRHPVHRAERLTVDQNDAFVAFGDLRQEFLDHPGLAESDAEQIEQRAEIGVLDADLEDGGAAIAIERLHHDFAMPEPERFNRGAIARNHRRGHEVGKVHSRTIFRARRARISDH